MQKKSADFYEKNYDYRNWNYVKFINKVLQKWKNYGKFQSSIFNTIARRKLIEDQNTILELSDRVQELQNEVNCMNVSQDFHGISGNVFVNPQASSTTLYPQELNPWWALIEEPLHMSTAEKSGRPERDQDLRRQSGSSAKDSVIFSGGDYSKNYGADQQRLQISELHYDTFTTPETFAYWKIWFKAEKYTCSQFPTDAMQWIKEVEWVDSVDDLRSSSSIRGISMPNFEVLDARIAWALNKIIHTSQFKRRISLEAQKVQKQDRFLRDRQIAYFMYD